MIRMINRSVLLKLVLPTPVILMLGFAALWYFVPKLVADNVRADAVRAAVETANQFKVITEQLAAGASLSSTLVVGGTGAALILILLTVAVSHGISAPLKTITLAMGKLADGDPGDCPQCSRSGGWNSRGIQQRLWRHRGGDKNRHGGISGTRFRQEPDNPLGQPLAADRDISYVAGRSLMILTTSRLECRRSRRRAARDNQSHRI